MVQWLKALAAIPDDVDWIPSINVVPHNPL